MTKQEKRQKNKETRALMLRFMKGSKRLFGVSMLAAAMAALADMISPQIIRAAIDNAIGGKEASFPAWVMRGVDTLGGFSYLGEHLWIMALAVVAVAVIKVTSQYIFRVSNTKASETLVKTMRDTAFSHIEHLPFSWHMKNRTGDIIQRCTSDIDTMKRFVSEQLTNVFRILVMLILSLVFMFSMDVPLTLIAFIPMLMDTGGNSGSQASVTIIRALSLGELEFKDAPKVIWKEIRTSVLCGVSLAVLCFAKIMLFDRLVLGNTDIMPKTAFVVCFTMAVTVLIAKMVGCSLPMVAKRLGFDPAVMASPFITTIVDALSLLVYFGIASAFLF